MRERRFVLAPLADLLPDLPIPGGTRTVVEYLEQLGDEQEIERLEWKACDEVTK